MGPYQFPEKLIPLFINNISKQQTPCQFMEKEKMYVIGFMLNDHARAIDQIFHQCQIGGNL